MASNSDPPDDDSPTAPRLRFNISPDGAWVQIVLNYRLGNRYRSLQAGCLRGQKARLWRDVTE